MKEPYISVITPSIRPRGLELVFETLKKQSYPATGWEWLPRLSIPGEESDLCYQMNRALKEARGDIIVFVQDWIELPEDALAKIHALYHGKRDVAYTFPVGKVDGPDDIANGDIRWDWRAHGHKRRIEYQEWEIDFGCVHKDIIGGYLFDEDYDKGFGWENVDLAYRLLKLNPQMKFKVVPKLKAVAWDHDKHVEHPYKKNPNQDRWLIKQKILDNT